MRLRNKSIIKRPLVYFVVSVIPMALAQPKLFLQQPDYQIGVRLRGQADPLFQATLSPGRSNVGDPLLPYAVVLDNSSDLAIIGYVLQWTGTDEAGKRIRHFRDYCDYQRLQALPAHSRALVSMVGDLNIPNAALSEKVIQHYVDIYQNQKVLSVAVDVLIFQDGTVTGPNVSRLAGYIVGRIKAEESVSIAALQAPRSQALSITLQTFVNRAAELAPQTRRSATLDWAAALDRWARHARTPEDALTAAQGYIALLFLQRSHEKGDAETIGQIQKMAVGKRYPNFAEVR